MFTLIRDVMYCDVFSITNVTFQPCPMFQELQSAKEIAELKKGISVIYEAVSDPFGGLIRILFSIY